MQLALSVPNSRQPSKKLEKLIDSCVSEFSKLNRTVNLALEQGRKEGFTDLEVGKLIRHKLITAGFSDRTARRYLPSSAKGKQGGASTSTSTNIVKTIKTDNLSVNSAVNSIGRSINRSIAASKSRSKNQDFQFIGRIASMGPRYIITIGTKHHSDIQKFLGKDVSITINQES